MSAAGVTAGVDAGMNLAMPFIQHQMNRDTFRYQWDIQKAYNDPSAQSMRLLRAGINPNTAFGSGSNANVQTPPEHKVAQLPMNSQLGAQIAQIENLKANTRLTNANAKIAEESKPQNVMADTALKGSQREINEVIQTMKRTEAGFLEGDKQRQKDFETVRNAMQRIELDFKQSDKELSQSYTREQIGQIKQAVKESIQRISEMRQKIKLMKSQEAMQYSQKMFQDLANLMRSAGIESGDNVFYRTLMNIGETIEDSAISKAFRTLIDNYLNKN